MTPGRLIVIQHEDGAPPGLLEPWARDRGLQLDVVRVDRGEPLPDPASAAGGVVLGATPSVFDPDLPWIEAELRWIADARAPLLGVCFGAQAIAAALGGRVWTAPRPEVGWIDVRPDRADLPFAAGPWLAWHSDVIDPPPAARRLAHNDLCVQAYELGPHLAVQFHPEVTAEIVAVWTAESPDTLAGLGLEADTVLADCRRHEAIARDQAFALFDAFMDRVRRAGVPAGGCAPVSTDEAG